VTNHLRLDLDVVELFARVDTNDAANHLRHDDHVSEVSLDRVRLLVGLGLLLGLAELLDETERATLQTAVEPSAGAGVDDIAELFGAEVEESVVWEEITGQFSTSSLVFEDEFDILVEVNATVGKLAEGSLALDLWRSMYVSM